MSTLNFLVFLNAYSDSNSSNNPTLGNFKWDREINGLSVNNPQSLQLSLAPGETKTLFSGSRTLGQDGTTEYSIALKAFTTNTYVLSWTGGTAPNFRTPRTSGADATTQVTVTTNGPLTTFASSGGTPFAFTSGGVVVGDYVTVGNSFNQLNQGTFKILSFTDTSFTVENETGTAEGPITLGSGFAAQVQIYSAAGVQAGDTLLIDAGFSPVTQGAYSITAVYANSLEFFSADTLPQESDIMTQVSIYFAAKKLVYVEADQHISMILNGVSGNEIQPLVQGSKVNPGVFMRSSVVYSMSVTNVSTDPANVFFASVE